jgi:hypothetical protein
LIILSPGLETLSPAIAKSKSLSPSISPNAMDALIMSDKSKSLST